MLSMAIGNIAKGEPAMELSRKKTKSSPGGI
jgi:hypothetical protein